MRSTLKVIKDDSYVSGFRYKRVPRNLKERFLKWRGWQPQGLALLDHPRYKHRSPVVLDVAWTTEMEHLKSIIRIK